MVPNDRKPTNNLAIPNAARIPTRREDFCDSDASPSSLPDSVAVPGEFQATLSFAEVNRAASRRTAPGFVFSMGPQKTLFPRGNPKSSHDRSFV
jgi:hypothetical protein